MSLQDLEFDHAETELERQICPSPRHIIVHNLVDYRFTVPTDHFSIRDIWADLLTAGVHLTIPRCLMSLLSATGQPLFGTAV